MVGGLVLLSLILITFSFRASSTGALHSVESAGVTVLRPFEVAAERVARPFRDVYGYFRGLVHAKSENERLRQQVNELRQQARAYTRQWGEDPPEVRDWTWPASESAPPRR